MTIDLIIDLAILAMAYLLGSIPFGLLLTKAARLGDIRTIGSGNIGATNVLRTGHEGLAAATLLLDGAKGTVAVFLALAYPWEPNLVYFASLAVLLGHLFPIWLRFRGGKGVATSLGIWLGLIWPVGVINCLTWLLVSVVSRYSSLAALVTLALAPAWGWWIAGPKTALCGLVMALLVIQRHHSNIRRLYAGAEAKIHFKKSNGAGL